MAKVTLYYTQTFWWDGRKLAANVAKRHKKDEEARRAAELASHRNAGVIAYSVTGDPEWDDWSDMKVLVEIGEVPEFA
jgi:hypothetical protein